MIAGIDVALFQNYFLLFFFYHFVKFGYFVFNIRCHWRWVPLLVFFYVVLFIS